MKKPIPLEKHFQAKVVKFLKTLPRTWHVKVSDRAKSGIPDILMGIGGRFVALELKRDQSEKPTPLQTSTLQQIHFAGNISLVSSPQNWDETKKFLSFLAELPPLPTLHPLIGNNK